MLTMNWLPGGESDDSAPPQDQHAAFRLSFTVTTPTANLVLRHCGVSWYNIYLDGIYVAEGPHRFVTAPYYVETAITVKEGSHVVAIHGHSVGETTRILILTQPFVACEILDLASKEWDPLPGVSWKCSPMPQYAAGTARMSPLLGWMEFCTIDAVHKTWRDISFDDSTWLSPSKLSTGSIPDPVPLAGVSSPASSVLHPLKQIDSGTLVERLGYQNDDPPARFALRQLTPTTGVSEASALDYGPAQGLYWRFDAVSCRLRRPVFETVIPNPNPNPDPYWRLMRPVFEVIGPAGTVFEIGYCQALIDGKVSPYHPLTGGPTCYMDRYVIGPGMGGKSLTITPLEPRGCR